MTGVGGDALDGTATGVDAHRPVLAKVRLDRKPLEEQGADTVGGGALPAFFVDIAEAAVDARHAAMRGESIRLNLGQGDWLRRGLAVDVVHRVRRILPTLVTQAMLGIAG